MGLRNFFDETDRDIPVIWQYPYNHSYTDDFSLINDYSAKQPTQTDDTNTSTNQTGNKQTLRSIKLELARPEKPVKATYLDQTAIDESRERAKNISKINAIMSVMAALADATQINKEGYVPVTGATANQVAGIPQFLQYLQRREDIGNQQYANALERYNSLMTGIANNEAIANYNAQREDMRLANQQKQADIRLEQEKMQQRTDVISKMIEKGASVKDINKQLRAAGLPEMTEETYARRKNELELAKLQKEVESEKMSPEAAAGLKLITEEMQKDGSAAAGGITISQDATMLNLLKGKKAERDAYLEAKFKNEIQKTYQQAQEALQAGDYNALQQSHDRFRELFLLLYKDENYVDDELKKLFPMLYQTANVGLQTQPVQTQPVQTQQPAISNTYNPNVPRYTYDQATGVLKNVDAATGKKIDELRQKIIEADNSIAVIKKQLDNPNLQPEYRQQLELALEKIIENATKATDELRALMNR